MSLTIMDGFKEVIIQRETTPTSSRLYVGSAVVELLLCFHTDLCSRCTAQCTRVQRSNQTCNIGLKISL